MEDTQFSLEDLSDRSYRDLQQLAKSMKLPSNVKKIYLIQLIHAKKFKTPAEVEGIVERVKYERQQQSQVRKRPAKRRTNLQGTEISSTSSPQSPPIDTTPKRRGQIIKSSPDFHPPIPRYSRSSVLRPYIKKLCTSPRSTPSDRVLRSFSLKPKQSLNSILNVVKMQKPVSPKEPRINVFTHYPKVNVISKGMVRKQRPNIIQSHRAALASQLRGQLVPVTSRMNIYPSMPAKRRRVLSGIYPIVTKETPKVSYEYIQSVGFRRSDGKISKINALVQKSLTKEPISKSNRRNIEMTVQELINSNIESQNVHSNIQDNLSSQYPNMSGVTDESNYQKQSHRFEERSYDLYRGNENPTSVYYHKKIRAEQVRCQRRDSVRDWRCEEERLPHINDVFSKFRDVNGRDVTQPIYVQVSDESERIFNYPVYTAKGTSSTTMLETLYNFKSQFLLSQPLLQVATTTATHCVFSTPLIATPVAHTSTVVSNDAYNVSSCERDSQSSVEPDAFTRANDFLRTAEQELIIRRNCRETVDDFSTSGSSLDRSNPQGLESSATIPEMVEDALEIISQDGDYMERIGMDVRVQCILCCNWAGPRFLLEYHIRKDHSSQIYRPDRSSCSVTYSLGRLSRRGLWLSQVLEWRGALYVLSAKCEPPDCFMACLSMLSSDLTPKVGHITIYNKVTGQPHTWSEEIYPLSPNLPYYTESNCLKLDISSLDLIPNSANLMLLNRELVIKSPSKVVVGRPELDDIQIIVFIKIADLSAV